MSATSRPARALHPVAWWLWAAAVAAAAMRTTNPLVLALLLGAVAHVVVSRRTDSPWSRSFGMFLAIGVAVMVFRLVVHVVFGARTGGTLLFHLPSVALPDWAAGVDLGGDVYLEDVARALVDGFRLAVVLACFGAVNSLASPYRLLRALPAVLYEAGVAVTMAVAFAPEMAASVRQRRDGQRLRGRADHGARALRGVAVPVLEGALDRSIELAASMDARGYGRRGAVAASVRRRSTAALVVGMLAAAVAAYGVLDDTTPRALTAVAAVVAVTLLGAAMAWTGARATRSRYRPDPFGVAEWLVVLGGVGALGALVALGGVDPEALAFGGQPLAWPTLPWLAVVAAGATALPALAAPPPRPVLVPAVAA